MKKFLIILFVFSFSCKVFPSEIPETLKDYDVYLSLEGVIGKLSDFTDRSFLASTNLDGTLTTTSFGEVYIEGNEITIEYLVYIGDNLNTKFTVVMNAYNDDTLQLSSISGQNYRTGERYTATDRLGIVSYLLVIFERMEPKHDLEYALDNDDLELFLELNTVEIEKYSLDDIPKYYGDIFDYIFENGNISNDYAEHRLQYALESDLLTTFKEYYNPETQFYSLTNFIRSTYSYLNLRDYETQIEQISIFGFTNAISTESEVFIFLSNQGTFDDEIQIIEQKQQLAKQEALDEERKSKLDEVFYFRAGGGFSRDQNDITNTYFARVGFGAYLGDTIGFLPLIYGNFGESKIVYIPGVGDNMSNYYSTNLSIGFVQGFATLAYKYEGFITLYGGPGYYYDSESAGKVQFIIGGELEFPTGIFVEAIIDKEELTICGGLSF